MTFRHRFVIPGHQELSVAIEVFLTCTMLFEGREIPQILYRGWPVRILALRLCAQQLHAAVHKAPQLATSYDASIFLSTYQPPKTCQCLSSPLTIIPLYEG